MPLDQGKQPSSICYTDCNGNMDAIRVALLCNALSNESVCNEDVLATNRHDLCSHQESCQHMSLVADESNATDTEHRRDFGLSIALSDWHDP
eukprot:60610-Amphidinium_carterae.1